MIYLELFWTFFKIGACTFGGGLAMLRVAQEQVLQRGWMQESEIVDFVALSESTPGPFAINMATYVGASQGNVLGAVCATLGVVLPSFIVILLVAQFYKQFKSSHVVKGLMTGLKPAAIGLIFSAVVTMSITVFFPVNTSLSTFKTTEFYVSTTIFLISIFLVFFKPKKLKFPPVLIICIAAGLGIAAGYTFNL